eukprot:718396-Pleurochrysis_carterae.AAC.2
MIVKGNDIVQSRGVNDIVNDTVQSARDTACEQQIYERRVERMRKTLIHERRVERLRKMLIHERISVWQSAGQHVFKSSWFFTNSKALQETQHAV